MKKQELFQLALMVCSFSEFILNAQQKRHVKNIDPIMDFRVPKSLMESLQEGVNGVYGSLQSDSFSIDTLQGVESQLNELVHLYDNNINTTRNNYVNDDDKAFLQKMIDRIDVLIAEIEGTSTDEHHKSVIRSIHNACQTLKHKVG